MFLVLASASDSWAFCYHYLAMKYLASGHGLILLIAVVVVGDGSRNRNSTTVGGG